MVVLRGCTEGVKHVYHVAVVAVDNHSLWQGPDMQGDMSQGGKDDIRSVTVLVLLAYD